MTPQLASPTLTHWQLDRDSSSPQRPYTDWTSADILGAKWLERVNGENSTGR